MIIYTGTSWSKKNQQFCADYGIGMMSSPVDLVHPDSLPKTIKVAGDNGAFRSFRTNTDFDDIAFYRWLDNIERELEWVSIPDKVCDWRASIELSRKHMDKITHKKYFVMQDGMTFDMIHSLISECDGVFIGGSTVIGKCRGWKWKEAPQIVKRCHEIGLPVHMGRCPGTVKALYSAKKIGIDSVDTSSLVRNQWLNRVPLLLDVIKEQKGICGWGNSPEI